MAKQSKAEQVEAVRTNEEYLIDQANLAFASESFQDWKTRTQAGELLYRGNLNDLFPTEQGVPDIPYVENKYKNALHDVGRLASEGRGMVKFIPRGDRDKDMKQARIRESIAEGYWIINRMKTEERKLYLDLAGTGVMAAAVYVDSTSQYPKIVRLDPRFCYPDVRNGKLFSLLTIEDVKERILARQFPDLGLNDDPTRNNAAHFVRYYDQGVVSEAVLTEENNKVNEARIVSEWKHNLGVIPVAFEMLDTYDGAFHGIFEQLAGPLLVRNKTIRYLVDYLESMAHAPIRSKGVLNPDDEPGPLTIYQIDPNQENWVFDRLPPAAPAGSVFGLLQYMQDQEEKEAIQPPSRTGNVSQSIASGSFVDRTQGQLTSVIKEVQDKQSSFREQINQICFRVDEMYLNDSKPLVRPVSGKAEYIPAKDIDGWYHHEVKFGAGAGLDRLNADTRVLNHLAARLISREEARAEIDYLDDSASSQDKIDREQLADALLQRMVRDPAVPLSVIGNTFVKMQDEGKALTEALNEVMPELLAAEQQAAAPGAPGLAEDMGEPEGPQAGRPVPQEELQQVTLQGPPLAQLFPGRNFR